MSEIDNDPFAGLIEAFRDVVRKLDIIQRLFADWYSTLSAPVRKRYLCVYETYYNKILKKRWQRNQGLWW